MKRVCENVENINILRVFVASNKKKRLECLKPSVSS